MSDVTIGELASALIAPLEGFRSQAYQDSGGIWTIGFGHTLGVSAGMICTLAEAQRWFGEDQAPLIEMVKDRPLVEAAALVSFGFNCGMGALQRVLGGHSTLMDFIHDHSGKELAGLVARRTLEETLILASQQMLRTSGS